MKATIWHNPNCGTSRKTLEILREAPGVEVEVVEYLKTPPSRDTLVALYRDAGLTPREGLRTRGSPAEELGLPNFLVMDRPEAGGFTSRALSS
jgi:arsenate reductase